LNEKEKSLSREARLRSALDSLFQQRQLHSLEVIVRTIEEKVKKIDRKRDQALEAARLFREKANRFCAEQLDRLFDVAFPMFSRVQANEVFDSLHRGSLKNPFDWVAKSSSYEFTPSPHFSMGQRQDLALAIFLARARGVKGTFFLDEPVIHLDDLNRVALMDTFRMLVLESEPLCNFIMTTARRDFVRHMAEKFANVPPVHGTPPLRIYELDGSPRAGVRVAKVWCAGVG
jgi:ABC-type glutathione transport system ATPase component